MAAIDLLFDGPDEAPLTLVLAHGAGAPMDSPFLNTVAAGVAAEGFRVARFEFPYMTRAAPQAAAAVRRTGRRSCGSAGST